MPRPGNKSTNILEIGAEHRVPVLGTSSNIFMPLGKNVGANIKELKKDNKKSGKAKGANGKVRPQKQIVAIALNAAGKSKKK